MKKIQKYSHKRYNPLNGSWVIISPNRLKRPWHGKIESKMQEERPSYDAQCYLCPGNKRAGGKRNPDYKQTMIFNNDFSALSKDGKKFRQVKGKKLLYYEQERGICRVVCYSPLHDVTMPQMSEEELVKVIEVWTKQYKELGKKKSIRHVQIFENKGELMGCSNPHPHGQIWATESIPTEPLQEILYQERYFELKKNSCLLCDYMKLEKEEIIRIVCENKSWMVVVPFWAVWPFETMVLPKRHLSNLLELTSIEKSDLANILKRLTIRYDNLFQISFPYSMGIHQSPTDGGKYPYYHLHFHFYPPLLRSATVRKFMVGFEMLATSQRDFSPEDAAKRLLELSETHYKEKRTRRKSS